MRAALRCLAGALPFAAAGAAPPGCAVFEKDWDLPGGDYSVSPTDDAGCVADGNCPCQKECESDPKCHAWTVVPGMKCCLKGSVPAPVQATGTGYFSGVKAQYAGSCGGAPTPPQPTPPAPPSPPPHVGPLACQDNAQQPMLPTYHIIGNVTENADGGIKLEAINDASGVTYYKGIYHVWHQCCQNHFDHVISKDLIHWQRLPPPIQPVGQRTFDGSVSMLAEEDGGPIVLYDAPDRIPKGYPGCGECILSVARLNNTNDKYLQTFTRDPQADPVQIELNGQKPVDFPSSIWRNGDHYNFIAQGSRFTTKDKSFRSWARAAPAGSPQMIGCGENGGQWWMPTPNQVGGSPPPPGTPNWLVNCGGGDNYRIGNYFPANESFIWSGKTARLEHGRAGWWGAEGGPANNNRMMMIGWVNDYHGPAGPGINFLTRLTVLREVNWDVKTESLVANPVPELTGLRTGSLASQKIGLTSINHPYVIANTGGGAAASSDTVIKFSDFGFGPTEIVFGVCVLGNGATNSGIGITITVNPGQDDNTHIANIQSGACQVGAPPAKGGDVQLFDESELTVRVLADRSVADWFVQGGRWAATNGWLATDPRKPEDSNVMVWSGSPGVSAQVDVYAMGCGWLNPSYTENPTM